MLTILFVLSTTGPFSPSDPANWRSCVIANAERWSMNRDGADVIADGAIGACQGNEPPAVSENEMRRVRQAAIAAVLAKRRP